MIAPYTVELDPPALPLRQGARGIAVQRVQEWLGLHGFGVAIDGDFGPATARAMAAFETRPDVDLAGWNALTHDLATASYAAPAAFGFTVRAIAQGHLHARAREIGGDNRGPWVRHYCRGQSVAWCQGFASTMWADAAHLLGQASPLDLDLDGIWCLFVPRMVQEAKAKGLFMPGGICDPALISPGSMFFLRGGAYGYLHVGLVEAVHADRTMTTLEGNTNEDGSANGYEVARRTRTISSCDYAVLPEAKGAAVVAS